MSKYHHNNNVHNSHIIGKICACLSFKIFAHNLGNPISYGVSYHLLCSFSGVTFDEHDSSVIKIQVLNY